MSDPYEITKRGFIEVYKNGTKVSQHNEIKEAIESALNHGETGEYVIKQPDWSFDIPEASSSPQPEPEPDPDPAPDPDPDPVPDPPPDPDPDPDPPPPDPDPDPEPPPDFSFVISGLGPKGIFHNDTGVAPGMTCEVWVISGSVEKVTTNGNLKGVTDGTVLEYSVDGSERATVTYHEE